MAGERDQRNGSGDRVEANAARIYGARRIAIIGPCGSGKSTLARELGRLTRLPVTHLDRIYWKPGWVESSTEEFRAAQSKVVEGDRWIIDGNYGGTFDIRIPRADLVIYLDFPRRVYFRRVLFRIVRGYGKVRPDLGPGCPEKLDLEFLRFVWRIPHGSRPRTLNRLESLNAGDRLITIGSPRELRGLMKRVEERRSTG